MSCLAGCRRRPSRADTRRCARAAFLPWPTPTVTVRSLGTMSPPANTPGQPVIIDGVTTTLPPRSNSTPGNAAEERGVRPLTKGEDDGVRGELLEAPGRPAATRSSSSSMTSTVSSGPSKVADRAQPVDPDALALGVLRLLGVRRHLCTGAPVNDERVLRAKAASDPGRVHRGVAAAVDRHLPAESPAAHPQATLRRNDTASRIREASLGRECRPASTGGRRRRRTRRRSCLPGVRRQGRSRPVIAGDPHCRARRGGPVPPSRTSRGKR